MHLYQEYANRMAINKKFIRYAEKSVVFLKSNKFRILSIEKFCKNPSPTKFKFTQIIPNKKEYEVEWDEYEKHIQSLNLKVLTDPEDIFIFGWESFVISYDSIISKNISYKTIFSTIDENLSVQTIKNNINIVEEIINNFDELSSGWNKIKSYIDNYSYWLAELIKNESCKNN